MASPPSIDRNPEALMRAYLASFTDADMTALFDLFAEDAVVRFPFAPKGSPERLDGIASIRGYYKDTPKTFRFDRYVDVVVHITVEPSFVIAEFKCEAVVLPKGRSYEQSYISTLRALDGKITEYQEFWNPILVLEALGGGDQMKAAFNVPVTPEHSSDSEPAARQDEELRLSPPPMTEARKHQLYPTLTADEVHRLARFGTEQHFKKGEQLLVSGQPHPGLFLIVVGEVAISRRDGMGHVMPMLDQKNGAFIGEVGQLSGRPALVDCVALTDVTASIIPAEALRTLIVAEAELGERIMRALILRRVSLIETGGGGPILIGLSTQPEMIGLQGFLARNGQPFVALDPGSDPDAAALLERLLPRSEDLPLVVCPDGSILRNPTNAALAACLGMLKESYSDRVYDVAIVGAGPGGLATAVYAASEGLDVLVIDARAFGGQAGASARIENYFGFPTGISGQALTGRAFVQAEKFGVEFAIPMTVARLDCSSGDPATPLALELTEGPPVRARTVVVASGARYRRPDIPGLSSFEGRGVWYWASPIEAKMCTSTEAVLVGGGNSAGQAAVYLSSYASKIWMLVRGAGLADTMSSYLVERINASPNIELVTDTEIVSLLGNPETGIEGVRWRTRATSTESEHAVRNVFLFVGADPETEWLSACDLALDAKGFVVTGHSLASHADEAPGATPGFPPSPLEASHPGVFAVGDVRAGSVKRVGGAIGEGAAVVAEIHAFLAASTLASPSASALGQLNQDGVNL